MTIKFWIWRHFWPLGVLAMSLLVLVSWVTESMTYVRGFGDDQATMKFMTALMFVIVSITLLSEDWPREMAAVALLAVVIWAFVGSYFAIGILPAFDDQGVESIAPGTPSLATIINFSAVLIWASWLDHNYRASVSAGLLVMAIAAVALTGYWINQPTMYYYSEHSTAMAQPTAYLFLAAGYHIVKTEYLKHSRGENYARSSKRSK